MVGSAGHLGSVGIVSGPGVDRAAVEAWVRSTCAAQGVPVLITEPWALRELSVLLGASLGGPRAHGAAAPSTRPPMPSLESPVR